MALMVDNSKYQKVRSYYDIGEQSGAHNVSNVWLSLLHNNSNGNLYALPNLNPSYSG